MKTDEWVLRGDAILRRFQCTIHTEKRLKIWSYVNLDFGILGHLLESISCCSALFKPNILWWIVPDLIDSMAALLLPLQLFRLKRGQIVVNQQLQTSRIALVEDCHFLKIWLPSICVSCYEIEGLNVLISGFMEWVYPVGSSSIGQMHWLGSPSTCD